MPKTKKSARQQAAPGTLKGWKAIGDYLGIGAAAAQRWAKNGMPVNRDGRFTVAVPDEIRRWLGKEAHMSAPAFVATNDNGHRRSPQGIHPYVASFEAKTMSRVADYIRCRPRASNYMMTTPFVPCGLVVR